MISTQNIFRISEFSVFHQGESRPETDSLSLMKDEGSSENSEVWIGCVISIVYTYYIYKKQK